MRRNERREQKERERSECCPPLTLFFRRCDSASLAVHRRRRDERAAECQLSVSCSHCCYAVYARTATASVATIRADAATVEAAPVDGAPAGPDEEATTFEADEEFRR